MKLFRALHVLDTERAHDLALQALKLLPGRRIHASSRLQTSLAGIELPHPIGLAAGFDKNATAIHGFAGLGFSFLEVGTVTPRPQPGNPKPRLFRLDEDEAVINRMGFNNDGAAAVAARVRKARHPRPPLGVNIGMNKTSAEALPDYLAGLETFLRLADYLTINVSSPNTPGLRALQQVDRLRELVLPLQQRRDELCQGSRRVPIFLKIAPDLEPTQADDIADLACDLAIEALLVSNTTIARPDSLRSGHRGEVGGLSGMPLMQPSTELLRRMRRRIGDRLPLVGIGGIRTAADVFAKLKAGAVAVQIYSAMVFEGPGLVARLVRDLDRLLEAEGVQRVADIVGREA